MCGASRAHNRISGNLFIAFANALRGGPCEVFRSDFKVRLQLDRRELFYYPDVMVACGQVGIYEYYLTEPKLSVEVLSPSTSKTDRREKALHYRQIDSLETYVMVAQQRLEVTLQRRQDEWRAQVLSAADALVEFDVADVSMPLNEIYAGAH